MRIVEEKYSRKNIWQNKKILGNYKKLINSSYQIFVENESQEIIVYDLYFMKREGPIIYYVFLCNKREKCQSKVD